MGKLPKEIISIRREDMISGGFNESLFEYPYIINEGTETETRIVSISNLWLTKVNRTSNEIIDDSNDFVNGFKIVELSNGQFAYVNLENELLPYRFDVASNFNEYGLAMIANNNEVSWIDKDFNYISWHGTTEKYDNKLSSGFKMVEQFSKGNNPLSRLHLTYNTVNYVKPSLEIKDFVSIKLNENNEFEISRTDEGEPIRSIIFVGTSNFENGIAEKNKDADEKRKKDFDFVLYDDGYYTTRGQVKQKEAEVHPSRKRKF